MKHNDWPPVVLMGVFLLALPIAARAQATDVDCDKCVDTADIAAGAVTSAQIKNGTITKADIAKDTITSGRIRNGTIRNRDISPDTIKSSRIKNGSISGDDIAANTISGNRIRNGTIKSVDIANGAISAAKLATNAVFENIILIRSDPADETGNCAELNATLDMFDPANSVRTLIKLEPGIYDCSNGGALSNVVMKPFVDIEGSGQGITRIRGDALVDGAGVIQTAKNAELRFLTVENTNADTGTFPHVVFAPELLRASYVTLLSADTGDGANEPVDCSNNLEIFPAAILRNSVIRAIGDEVMYSCGGGVYVSTEIDADTGMGAGTHICHGAYDQNFAALDTNCASGE